MPLPMAAATVLGNEMCRERVRSPSHLRRPTVNAALDGIFRTEQPSKPQSGRKRFREAANTKHLAAICQCIEAGRHCAREREIAIDIVLYNQQVILAS